jgi:hypothetical protein
MSGNMPSGMGAPIPPYVELRCEHQHSTRTDRVKIIVALEDEYRAYHGALAATIRILRPDAELVTAELEKISRVVKRFGPDIIRA